MHTMLESMHRPCSNNMYQHQLSLVLRDGMLFSLLWQSCFRGCRCCEAGQYPVAYRRERSALSDPSQQGTILHVSEVTFRELITKAEV